MSCPQKREFQSVRGILFDGMSSKALNMRSMLLDAMYLRDKEHKFTEKHIKLYFVVND